MSKSVKMEHAVTKAVTIHPTTLNHNTIIAANSLAPVVQNNPQMATMVADIKQQAQQQEFKSPMEVQSAAFQLSHMAGKNASTEVHQGIDNLAQASMLRTKLPVFDTSAMQEQNVPKMLVDAAAAMNHELVTGSDPATLEAHHQSNIGLSPPQAPQITTPTTTHAHPTDIAGIIGS